MSTATDHARTLLAAIIPGRRDLLDRALRHLTAEHFPDLTLRNVFLMLERYAEVTGAIVTRDALHDLLVTCRADASKIGLYLDTNDRITSNDAEPDRFRE